jgi:hypothetical protein
VVPNFRYNVAVLSFTTTKPRRSAFAARIVTEDVEDVALEIVAVDKGCPCTGRT